MGDATQGLRLNKALAGAGLCARRKADALIFAGAVSVNGRIVVEPGRRIDPDNDRISVHGRNLNLRPPAPCRLMLHKPVRVLSTARDPEGRTTVLDILPARYAGRRLYPVGRLDYFSEGLLLVTDDGALAHPGRHVPRRNEVLVRGEVGEAALAAMRAGMTLAEGETLAGIEAGAEALGRDTLVHMTLRQGVNRQIRRMCRDLGLTILRLVRTGFGPLQLGGLAPGCCRELTARETAALEACLREDGLSRHPQANTGQMRRSCRRFQ
jgi:23S rRNA pseudouridine2605 synthase